MPPQMPLQAAPPNPAMQTPVQPQQAVQPQQPVQPQQGTPVTPPGASPPQGPEQPPQALAFSDQPTPGYDLTKGPWFKGRFAVENTPPEAQQAVVNTIKPPVTPLNGAGGTDVVQKMAEWGKSCARRVQAAEKRSSVAPLEELGVPGLDISGRNRARGRHKKKAVEPVVKDMALDSFGKAAARMVLKSLGAAGCGELLRKAGAERPRGPFQKVSFPGMQPAATASQPHTAGQQLADVQQAQAGMAGMMQSAPVPEAPGAPSPQLGAASGNPLLQPKSITRPQAMMGDGPLTDGFTGLYGMKKNPMVGGSAPGNVSNMNGALKSASDIGPCPPAPQTFQAGPRSGGARLGGKALPGGGSTLGMNRAIKAPAMAPRGSSTKPMAGMPTPTAMKVAAGRSWAEKLQRLRERRGELPDADGNYPDGHRAESVTGL